MWTGARIFLRYVWLGCVWLFWYVYTCMALFIYRWSGVVVLCSLSFVSVWDDASVKRRVSVLVSPLLFRIGSTKGDANLSIFIRPFLFLGRHKSDWISVRSLKMSTSFLKNFFSRVLFFGLASLSFSFIVRTCVCYQVMFSLFFFQVLFKYYMIFLLLIIYSFSAKIFLATVVSFFCSWNVGLEI